ncbi:FHA domain-containing protein [Actinoplanes sp. NPDC051861]|uniref:FHA domain-containing protein n=1 Tax=Actinoplanes sp. NPDC051861 TaxID=3155170 RepID=UPI00341A5C99
MTSYVCPKGHTSAESDFCDTCGARISPSAEPSASPSSAPTAVLAEPAPAAGPQCPHCGTPRSGTARFCEDCGFDHTTGKIPQLVAPSEAVAADWTATVFADRAYFDLNETDGVDFPQDSPERTVILAPPQVRIGRRSASKGTDPELDLSETPADPGVSHSHALLTLSVDGVWLVSDLGSTNGTYLNDEDRPLGAGQSRLLKDGDQVHVGVWTTITLHAPPAG